MHEIESMGLFPKNLSRNQLMYLYLPVEEGKSIFNKKELGYFSLSQNKSKTVTHVYVYFNFPTRDSK